VGGNNISKSVAGRGRVDLVDQVSPAVTKKVKKPSPHAPGRQFQTGSRSKRSIGRRGNHNH
jgi:hypothetical protein